MSPRYLPEIPETEARGRVAEVYEEIRRTLGLPVVNLVYRHLAVEPTQLDAAWGELRPNLTAAAARSAARRLVDAAAVRRVVAVPPSAAAAIGVDAPRAAFVRATLDAYARANSLNLLGMQALLHGCGGTADAADAEEPPVAAAILPLADMSALPASTLALLDEMSAALVGDDEPRLVPSLLRHFAGDPALLALLWTALRPAAGALTARRAAVAAEARALAGRLPHPVSPVTDPVLRATAAQFAAAMSAMLVTGEAIRAALGRGG